MTSRYELGTTNLRLQPCRIEDVPLVHALWTNEHVRHFLFDDRVISLDEARLFVEGSLANFEQYGYGLWLVFPARESYRLVGFAGFLRLEEETPNLIYGVHPDFRGCGYATEAAEAVLSYAFEELDLTQVKADVDEPNVASVRVLEKLGMRRTGRAVVEGRPLLYFERARVEGEVAQNHAAEREERDRHA
jgi:RimJ/RimL family protein N-acetyltransferase